MKKRCSKSGKVKFDTHEKALERAGEIMATPRQAALGAYLCRHCGKYHLTKQGFNPLKQFVTINKKKG